MTVIAGEPANTVEDRDLGPQDRAQPLDHEALSRGALRQGGGAGRGGRAGGGRGGRAGRGRGHVTHSVIHALADIRAPPTFVPLGRWRLGLAVAGVIVASAVSDAIVIVRVASEHATAGAQRNTSSASTMGAPLPLAGSPGRPSVRADTIAWRHDICRSRAVTRRTEFAISHGPDLGRRGGTRTWPAMRPRTLMADR